MAETKTDEERLLDLINKIAEEQKFKTYNLKVTPISSGGANYTSKLYIVKITEEGREELSLFAKVAAVGDNFRNHAQMNPFENEVLVYTNLMTAYKRLEDKHGVSEDNRLKVTKYYGADRTHMREILVLEDLTSRRFGPANRFQSVDWQYAAAAVTELAKFHALSIAYQHEKPSEYDKIYEEFSQGMFEQTEDSDVFFISSTNQALGAVRKENKEKLKAFLNENKVSNLFSMFKPLSLEVLMHVDFRPNNMLHRIKDDGTTEVIPVDYQTIQGGCPLIDLLYFIFTATDGQFRAQHYQELVDHYHSELGAALARLGLNIKDIYPRKVFDFELNEKLSYGLLVSVMFLPILTIPEDQAPALGKELNMTDFAVVNTGDLYRQRLNDVVDNYVEWGFVV